MDKMRMESVDLTQKNIERLYELFPSVITEKRGADGQIKRAVNFELLKQLLSGEVAEGDEAYEFTWVGKKEAMAEAGRPIRKTLRPWKEESKNWELTENLYIEGDNLEVLKLLQESYLGKVKMIYIDPPYNTGKDFLYVDNFRQNRDEYEESQDIFDEEGNRLIQNKETRGRFHSDWCSMLYPRLMLSRNILSDDGVIVINMDENEIKNLQNICSEVFGESNDLGTIVWDKRNPKGDSRGISYQHEYILVYAKNKPSFLESCKIQRPKKNATFILEKAKQLFSKVNGKYTLEDANREFSSWISAQVDFSGGEKAYNKIDELGNVYQAVSMGWPNRKKAPADYFVPLIHPLTNQPCPVPEKGWRNPSATMNDLLAKGLIVFGKDELTQPRRKYLLKENMYENIPSLLYYGGSDTNLLSSLNIPFDTPKVVNVCKEHIQAFTHTDDIILDFFSGSATTAHAVMALNSEDGGSRKFIMVQLPEETDEKSDAYKDGFVNICEIGKERIRRAGDKIQDENKNSGKNTNLDIGFRVFKLDDSNMKDVYYSADQMTQDLLEQLESNIKENRTDLDLLYGCLLEWGLPLSLPYRSEDIGGATIHVVNDGDLIACFDSAISEEVVREIAKRRPLRVVFRDGSFENTPAKINVEEIFKLLAPNTRVKVI